VEPGANSNNKPNSTEIFCFNQETGAAAGASGTATGAATGALSTACGTIRGSGNCSVLIKQHSSCEQEKPMVFSCLSLFLSLFLWLLERK